MRLCLRVVALTIGIVAIGLASAVALPDRGAPAQAQFGMPFPTNPPPVYLPFLARTQDLRPAYNIPGRAGLYRYPLADYEGRLLMAVNDRVQTWDLSELAQPRLLGVTEPVSGTIDHMVTAGDLLLAHVYHRGPRAWIIFDLSQGPVPPLVGGITFDSGTGHIYPLDGWRIIFRSGYAPHRGWSLVDLSDPAAPVFSRPAWADAVPDEGSLLIVGEYLYQHRVLETLRGPRGSSWVERSAMTVWDIGKSRPIKVLEADTLPPAGYAWLGRIGDLALSSQGGLSAFVGIQGPIPFEDFHEDCCSRLVAYHFDDRHLVTLEAEEPEDGSAGRLLARAYRRGPSVEAPLERFGELELEPIESIGRSVDEIRIVGDRVIGLTGIWKPYSGLFLQDLSAVMRERPDAHHR